MVDRQRLAGDGELEHPLGTDALALDPVEVLRQLAGLLTAIPDVRDDPLLPDVERLAVPGVDPVGGVSSAKTTLDTYGHLWPDRDNTSRAAVAAVCRERPGATRGEA